MTIYNHIEDIPQERYLETLLAEFPDEDEDMEMFEDLDEGDDDWDNEE